MNTRLASYSKLNCKKVSAKAIKEAYKAGIEFDLQITDMFNPKCGSYVSPQELKKIGEKQVYIRFNSDRSIMMLGL